MNNAEFFGSTLGLIFMIFMLIVGILWFLMPFAVFGIKARLDEHLKEVKQTNRLLTQIAEASKAKTARAPAADEDPLNNV